MTDVLLQQTNNDGELDIVSGVVVLTGSFETMAYLCLFGGNEDDSGRDGDPRTYWGNLTETDQALKEISRTQNLLALLPPSSANLKRLEDAAKADLAIFVDQSIANTLEVVATMPDRNSVKLAVTIEAVGDRQDFEFIENWEAGASGT